MEDGGTMKNQTNPRAFFLKMMFFVLFTLTFYVQDQPLLLASETGYNSSNVISVFKIDPNPVPNPLEPVSIFIHITQADDKPYTCAVNLGDGTLRQGCGAFTHLYSKSGKYDVTLEITDSHGNKTVRTVTVTVKDKRPAKVTGLTLTLEPVTIINKKIQKFVSGTGQPPTLQDYNALGIKGVTLENLEDINFLIKKHGDLTKKQIQKRVNIRNNAMGKIITYASDTKAPAPEIQDYTDIGITGVNTKNLYEINSFLVSHVNPAINSIKKLQALINNFYAYKWKIGARPVAATPVSKATMFADPDGNGNLCSYSSPCSIHTAFSRLKAGDVLFLRGGTYTISETVRIKESGKIDKPIVIESFPGELAILKGLHGPDAGKTSNVRTNGITISKAQKYIHIRKLEIKDMGWAGIAIFGSYNLVEGCNVHHNLSSGIVLYGGEWHENRPGYKIPYDDGYNTIKDNIVHDNSDASLATKGGNADGIAVSSGRFNRIIHNTVYSNSDDGIDLWRSNYSFVAFNISYNNGKANGDGQGIKAGGNLNPQATNGLKANVQHNISYSNKRNGFDVNAGKQVVFKYNTAWKNGRSGFVTDDDTTVEFNLAAENAIPTKIKQGHQSNSWQRSLTPKFVSKDPKSPDFLRPAADSGLVDTGAYANLPNP